MCQSLLDARDYGGKEDNRVLDLLELPVHRGAGLTYITILIVISLWSWGMSWRPKQAEGPVKTPLREGLSGHCRPRSSLCKGPEARRKLADEGIGHRRWGWRGVEAEGQMGHRRLEESLPPWARLLPMAQDPEAWAPWRGEFQFLSWLVASLRH